MGIALPLKMSSWCIVKLPVTANNIKILGVAQKLFWGLIYVAGQQQNVFGSS